MRASSLGVSVRNSLPLCRLYSPANRSASKRWPQLRHEAVVAIELVTDLCQFAPSANIRIQRARRASSARIVRPVARSFLDAVALPPEGDAALIQMVSKRLLEIATRFGVEPHREASECPLERGNSKGMWV